MKKWLPFWILFGSLTITIPDSKDQFVIDARNAYNSRTGQSLTTLQYVKEVLRRGVANELVQAQQAQLQATVSAFAEQCQSEQAAMQQAQEQYFQSQLSGW